jgi:predicted 3-demethylubiquinone-9 3-methyltransferase (glyoxalase superfamily)
MTQADGAVAAADTRIRVGSITPCLTFSSRCEEALNLYVSLLPDARIRDLQRWPEGGPAGGGVMSATLELGGQTYHAFDGGETFAFSEGVSFMVTCATQADIDRLWDRLTAGGGEPGRCGWLKDPFGFSWQIIPEDLGDMLGNPAGGNSGRALEEMLKMDKLDIATLRAAYAERA